MAFEAFLWVFNSIFLFLDFSSSRGGDISMGGNVRRKNSNPAPGFVLLYIALLSPHRLPVEINTLITSAA